jgi:hypothetical protein
MQVNQGTTPTTVRQRRSALTGSMRRAAMTPSKVHGSFANAYSRCLSGEMRG